jgi:benzoyl-CoA reductase/2-hydroxyglutaryl-CoA dehydratase subunit BcrC/BadD/HgdB|uniref:2-hydroxyacyl-CoA dehydratase n=1 Tax=candidate division WOR-3 bacterium TaxID=2052148 RepID=A0A7V3RHH1_UNCW3
MELIGYTCCSYIPIELLSATGLKPYRLMHGDPLLSLIGERLVRVDACPLIKSNIGFVLENKKRFACIIGSTGCDMERRMLEIIRTATGIPVHILNNPRTDNFEIFNNEIDLLVRELEQFFHRKFDKSLVQKECERWKKVREQFQEIDAKRRSNPSTLSTTTFHKMVTNLYKGNLEGGGSDTPDEMTYKPRVYLLGSPISYESGPFIDLIEKRLRICGDYNCGLSRDIYTNVSEPTIEGLKKTYYNLPYIFKRPNITYYEWIEKELKLTKSTGIIVSVLDYCDNFDFEISRMEKRFKLPILKLKSDFSFQNQSQMKVRIDAFIEVLASYRSGVV